MNFMVSAAALAAMCTVSFGQSRVDALLEKYSLDELKAMGRQVEPQDQPEATPDQVAAVLKVLSRPFDALAEIEAETLQKLDGAIELQVNKAMLGALAAAYGGGFAFAYELSDFAPVSTVWVTPGLKYLAVGWQADPNVVPLGDLAEGAHTAGSFTIGKGGHIADISGSALSAIDVETTLDDGTVVSSKQYISHTTSLTSDAGLDGQCKTTLIEIFPDTYIIECHDAGRIAAPWPKERECLPVLDRIPGSPAAVVHCDCIDPTTIPQ